MKIKKTTNAHNSRAVLQPKTNTKTTSLTNSYNLNMKEKLHDKEEENKNTEN